MEYQEVEKKIREFLTVEFEINDEILKPEADLKNDLGIDSLDFVDISVTIENSFGFKISAEEIKNLKSYEDFCKTIHKKTL